MKSYELYSLDTVDSLSVNRWQNRFRLINNATHEITKRRRIGIKATNFVRRVGSGNETVRIEKRRMNYTHIAPFKHDIR
jgi:hypothetical protein